MARYYEQNPTLPAHAKQTQSNPIQPVPAPVFDPKIGFERSEARKNERSYVCFLQVYTKKYTLLMQIMFSFCAFSSFCARNCVQVNPDAFPPSQALNEKKLMPKPLSLNFSIIDNGNTRLL